MAVDMVYDEEQLAAASNGCAITSRWTNPAT